MPFHPHATTHVQHVLQPRVLLPDATGTARQHAAKVAAMCNLDRRGWHGGRLGCRGLCRARPGCNWSGSLLRSGGASHGTGRVHHGRGRARAVAAAGAARAQAHECRHAAPAVFAGGTSLLTPGAAVRGALAPGTLPVKRFRALRTTHEGFGLRLGPRAFSLSRFPRLLAGAPGRRKNGPETAVTAPRHVFVARIHGSAAAREHE
jgi:hypothetical protein